MKSCVSPAKKGEEYFSSPETGKKDHKQGAKGVLLISQRETEAQRTQNHIWSLKRALVRLLISSQKYCFRLFPDLLAAERWEIW